MRAALRLLLFLVAMTTAGSAGADAPLRLDDTSTSFDAWGAVRVLEDHGARLSFDEVLRRTDEFAAPLVPANNFGPRTGALWIHVRMFHSSGVRRWVLEIDYPPLNRVDAYLVRDGRVQRSAAMGNAVPAPERPMRSRAHAMMLELVQGATYDLYVRVQTTSAVVVPIRFHHADAFVNTESARLLLQGLLFGITLMLLTTSVVNGLSLRDPVFGHYALMIVGISTFFVSFSGLGHQFLWATQTGLLAKVAPWGALLATAGAAWFVCGALDLDRTAPRAARLLGVVATSGGVAIGASMIGLLDYRQAALAATVLGPLAIVLALHATLGRAWQGDRVAVYMTIGWGAYTLGALSMAAVLRGWVAVNFWVQHLFQFASVVEMFAWMRVLALRIEVVRRDADRSAAEKHALRSLAHTDPLTGLPNRRGLAEALEAALPGARPDSALVVYLADLDGFKAVNDRFGHDAGDELLIQVAARLRDSLRVSDVVARLGGDEFVVMSQGIAGEAAAMHIGEKMLDAFRTPFIVADQVCSVGLTIGFAMAPHDGDDAGDLLRRADAAMYAGKQAGRNCVRRGAASAGLAAAS